VPYIATQAETVNPKVLQIFCEDAEKAITTLKETVSNKDIKLFTITAHAMKSASANVGEHDASLQASALENAGHKNDIDFINANTDAFIKTLESLIEKLKITEIISAEDSETLDEDPDYLSEQLEVIKTACTHYDDDTAYAALDKLNNKKWSTKTSGILEQIRDMLFIYSDFDGVVQRITELQEQN